MRAAGRKPIVEASAAFLRAYKKLPSQLQKAVDETVEKLWANPRTPGLHCEKIRGAPGRYSCRVNRAIRLVFERREGGGVRLVGVGAHEAAYRYYADVLHLLSTSYVAAMTEAELGGYSVFAPHREELWQDVASQIRNLMSQDGRWPPETVSAVVNVIERALRYGTKGKATARWGPDLQTAPNRRQGLEGVNVIPAETRGECRAVLVAFCFDRDGFDDRLREVVYHAGVHCPETRLVILVTSKWDPVVWRGKHERAFADLPATVAIYLTAFDRMVRLV